MPNAILIYDRTIPLTEMRLVVVYDRDTDRLFYYLEPCSGKQGRDPHDCMEQALLDATAGIYTSRARLTLLSQLAKTLDSYLAAEGIEI